MPGLGNLQGDGMGEGWSDFYAVSLSSAPTDDPDAVYAMGGYVTHQLGGWDRELLLRHPHFPLHDGHDENPLTYKDIDPTQISPHTGIPRSPINPFDPSSASEVHQQGEI